MSSSSDAEEDFRWQEYQLENRGWYNVSKTFDSDMELFPSLTNFIDHVDLLFLF